MSIGQVRIPAKQWTNQWAKHIFGDEWRTATVCCDVIRIQNGKFVVKYENEPEMLFDFSRLLTWDLRFRNPQTDEFLPWNSDLRPIVTVLLETRETASTPQAVVFLVENQQGRAEMS